MVLENNQDTIDNLIRNLDKADIRVVKNAKSVSVRFFDNIGTKTRRSQDVLLIYAQTLFGDIPTLFIFKFKAGFIEYCFVSKFRDTEKFLNSLVSNGDDMAIFQDFMQYKASKDQIFTVDFR